MYEINTVKDETSIKLERKCRSRESPLTKHWSYKIIPNKDAEIWKTQVKLNYSMESTMNKINNIKKIINKFIIKL